MTGSRCEKLAIKRNAPFGASDHHPGLDFLQSSAVLRVFLHAGHRGLFPGIGFQQARAGSIGARTIYLIVFAGLWPSMGVVTALLIGYIVGTFRCPSSTARSL